MELPTREKELDEISNMIHNNIEPDISFLISQTIKKEKEISFGRREQKTLGLINEKEMYTNLGLLLSDQCPYTIKMAVYPNDTKVEFLRTVRRSRKIFKIK
ncbi:MAG: hypothetical protein WC177_00050 [Bacilli bacterium]